MKIKEIITLPSNYVIFINTLHYISKYIIDIGAYLMKIIYFTKITFLVPVIEMLNRYPACFIFFSISANDSKTVSNG